MTKRSESGLWIAAALVSAVAHLSAGALLLALSDEASGSASQTRISVVSVPTLAAPPLPAALSGTQAPEVTVLSPSTAGERVSVQSDPERVETASGERQSAVGDTAETMDPVAASVAERQSAETAPAVQPRPQATAAVSATATGPSPPSRALSPAAAADRQFAARSEGTRIARSDPDSAATADVVPLASATARDAPSAERVSPSRATSALPPATSVPVVRTERATSPPAPEVAVRPAAPLQPRPAPTDRPARAPAEPVARAQVAPAVPGADGSVRTAAVLAPTRPTAEVQRSVEDRYRGVLDFLRAHEGGGCFVALPSARPGGRVGLDTFAGRGTDLAGFVRSFEGATGVSAETTLDTVAADQCRVLSFARTLPGYPAFSLYFEMPERRIASGSQLSGTIRNVDRRHLHLLLIDDEGIVQNVDGFISRVDRDAQFAAHMTLTGGPVATVQLLVAIAVPGPLDVVRSHNGNDASSFFAAMTEEIAARRYSPDMAVASFSVD